MNGPLGVDIFIIFLILTLLIEYIKGHGNYKQKVFYNMILERSLISFFLEKADEIIYPKLTLAIRSSSTENTSF